LVLLLVGGVSEKLIETHKRLRSFSAADFRMLRAYVGDADLVTLPNSLTEVSNLLRQGVTEPARSRLTASLASFAQVASEVYVQSREAVKAPEFTRLGLTDCAWLQALSPSIELLTVDLGLYLAALDHGITAINFNHLRDL
jgi:hypothetical protein